MDYGIRGETYSEYEFFDHYANFTREVTQLLRTMEGSFATGYTLKFPQRVAVSWELDPQSE